MIYDYQGNEIEAGGSTLIMTDDKNLLYIGTVEQGERGQQSITSSNASVAMSNTVGVPFEQCKIKATLPTGIVAYLKYGTTSQTLTDTQTINNNSEWSFPSNVEYYSINFKKSDGTNISYSDVQNYIDNGSIMFNITNGDNTSAVGRNSQNEAFAKAAMRIGVTTKTGYGSNLSIIHVSDLHGDAVRAESFFELAQDLGVDYVVHTGDVVGWPYNGFSFFKDAAEKFSMKAKTINCNGNHDVFDSSASDIFNANIKPFTDAMGVSTSNSYYYVDNSTHKVRFVVLDCFENAATLGHNKACITGTQIDWLIATLQSVPADYGVILCYHVPADDIISNNLGFYQSTLAVTFDKLSSYGGGISGAPLQKIINAFIRKESISGSFTTQGSTYSYSADFTSVPSSAEFICHLTGHEHSDRIGYYTGYDGNTANQSKQLCCNVATANALYGTAYPYLAHLSDCPRGGRGFVQDCFNVMTIVRSSKKIQVTRMGSFVTRDMEERLTAEFAYA